MFQQNNQQQEQGKQKMPPNLAFGGHELFDVDESIGALVHALEHQVLYEQYIQDQELATILNRQRSFMTQLYNTILDTLQSGTDPSVKTQTYMMQENNETMYGMTPSSPKMPAKSVNEFNDECISSSMLAHLKAIASAFTVTALEATNPVLRRIFADSVPNIIEMAYETYLYQNKHGYYQVAQLAPQDMQSLTRAYQPMDSNMQH